MNWKRLKSHLKLKKLKICAEMQNKNHMFKLVESYVKDVEIIIERDAGSYKMLALTATIEAYNL